MFKNEYDLPTLCALMLISLFTSCEKCEDTIRVFGDLELQESALEIAGILEPEELVFIDSSGREFIVTRTSFESGLRRVDSGPFGCEEGGVSEGFYFAEERTSNFLGGGVEIIISLKTFSDELGRNESEMDLSKTTGRDVMEVDVIISGCDTLHSLRGVQAVGTGEPNIQTSLVPFRKFGQIHRNPFRLRSFPYEGDMMFTKEKGLVSFNHCGLELVQIGE